MRPVPFITHDPLSPSLTPTPPPKQSRLREIFLKTDNLIAGRYLAEVTQQVMSDLDASKYQLVEWRVSIYGRKPSEWDKLARWFYTHRLASDKVRWLIQIPRLYAVYKASGEIDDFEHILRNIFAPLFEASRDPQSNVPLATFLETIVGFDCVDDESKPELHSNQGQRFPPPKEWKYKQDPPYSYWCYYLYANIKSLNDFRRERGKAGRLEGRKAMVRHDFSYPPPTIQPPTPTPQPPPPKACRRSSSGRTAGRRATPSTWWRPTSWPTRSTTASSSARSPVGG